ncbi:hypothetical protein AB0H86_07125 [Streptomyces sp. NPDC050997]|uniref:hypothetical protein n=1 Tax=Streptomyces sp. NPDC050997 TaxID=3155519 RepID=UPI0034368CC7
MSRRRAETGHGGAPGDCIRSAWHSSWLPRGVLASAPASAANRPAASYVTGRGVLSDDWGDENLLDAPQASAQ